MTHHDDHDRITGWPSSAPDRGNDMAWTATDGSVYIVQCKQYPGSAVPVGDNLVLLCPICATNGTPPDPEASALTAAASGRYLAQGDVIAALPGRQLLVEGPSDALVLATLILTPPAADHEPGGAEFGRLIRQFKAVMRHWDQVAQQPHLPSYTVEALSARVLDQARAGWRAITAARCAVTAAYIARNAVVHEHPSISHQVVGEFVARWLGLRPTRRIVEAAANALLQAPLDGTHPDGDHAVVRRLRAATRTQRRAWRPLGETKIRHAPVDYLDRHLPSVGDEQPLVLADTVGTCDQPTADAGWSDPRIARVLGRLHSAERQVVLAYAHADTAITWTEAAHRCRQDAAFGERVRRKLQREGRVVTARIAGSSPTRWAA